MAKSPLPGTKKQVVKHSLMIDRNGLLLALVVAAASTRGIRLVTDTLNTRPIEITK